MYNIKVNNNIINTNTIINQYNILVYISIYILCNNSNINYYININNILGLLYNTLDVKRATKENIKQSLDCLAKKCIIEKYNDSTYKVDPDELNLKGNYTLCPENIFWQFKDSPELLIHYLWIVRSMDYNIRIGKRAGVISHMPFSYFMNKEGLCEATIKKYSKLLSQANVICVAIQGEKQLYSLFKDKDCLDYFVTYYRHIQTSRSVAAQYKYFCQAPTKYKAAEKAKLRSLVEQYNEDCLLLGKYQPDYLQKVKDLDVFDLF